jgi:uracil-DNA glycosylase
LPAPVPSTQAIQPRASAPVAIENSATASISTPRSVELFSKYPGLEATSSLENLREFIGDCARCKLAPFRKNLVFGIGNPDAQLMFVGEAPGADEDARGEPFVGRAGQLLTDIIERGMGLERSDVYICNVIKCRPPDNRNPEPDEVASCEPFLFRQIESVRPRGIRFMPTFHPAYLLRNPADKRLVWADIQEVMRFLEMPIPRRGGSPS